MPKNSGYFFRGEAVHVVDTRVAVGQFFVCRRCDERKHESQFSPLPMAFSSSAKMALHPHCQTCRQQSWGKWVRHPLYSPLLDKRMATLLRSVRSSATARGVALAIDKDDLIGLYLLQSGKCALTGLDLDIKARGYAGRNGRAMLAPSLDRISSNGNYVLSNVQLLANVVNVMKNDLKQDQFIKLCQLVAEHRVVNALAEQIAA